MSTYFKELFDVDVSSYVETKNGGLTYLPWANAVHLLLEKHHEATWEVTKFKDANGCEAPFAKTECGYFVEVAVTVNGIRRAQMHPVLDESHSSIIKPTSFDINTSIQRCLVKAISLHGLGLGLYLGIPTEPFMNRVADEMEADGPTLFVLQNVESKAGNDDVCYYIITLDNGNEPFEVVVYGDFMEEFENSNLCVGDKLEFDGYEHSGKVVATMMRKVG